jgi:hypothetical protein
MFGLSLAAVLSLIVTPVLYAIFFGVREPAATTEEAQMPTPDGEPKVLGAGGER